MSRNRTGKILNKIPNALLDTCCFTLVGGFLTERVLDPESAQLAPVTRVGAEPDVQQLPRRLPGGRHRAAAEAPEQRRVRGAAIPHLQVVVDTPVGKGTFDWLVEINARLQSGVTVS